jgi:proteasome lid subunit RPN8/RPN11
MAASWQRADRAAAYGFSMLVATKNLIASDPVAGEVRFLEGVSCCSDDYWLALERPECFRPAERSAGGIRSGRTRVAPSPEHTDRVRLVTARRQIEKWRLLGGGERASLRARDKATGSVRLCTSARDKIASEIARELRGFEIGGALLGGGDGRVFDVLSATEPGPDARRRRSSLLLDSQWIEREAQRQGLEIVGVWHTHPSGGLSNRHPSPTDLNAFRDWADDNLGAWLGLIATPRRSRVWCLDAWRIDGHRCLPTNIWGIEHE